MFDLLRGATFVSCVAIFGHEVTVLPPTGFDHLGLKSLHLAVRTMGNNVA